MVKTLGNYNVNLRKVLTGYGFYVSVVFTILLLALSSIYSTCNTFKGSEINKNFTIDKSRQIVTMATKGNIQ